MPTCTWEEHQVALTASGFPREKVQMPFLCDLFTKPSNLSGSLISEAAKKKLKAVKLCFYDGCTASH